MSKPDPYSKTRADAMHLREHDCSTESEHLWERNDDGSWLCVWCFAKVRRVGR